MNIGHLTLARGLAIAAFTAFAAFATGAYADGPATDDAARVFDYDRSLPLDLKEASSRAEAGVTIRDVSYASPKGGRVPAYVVVPDGKGPFAGIVLLHGAPGSRETTLPRAVAYARTGAVVIAISAPFARRGPNGPPTIYLDSRDRDDVVQCVVDLRRAVDVLVARPDVDAKRVAYVGGSFGGATGGLLAGVEHRIKAYALWSGDGGHLTHLRAMGDDGPLSQLTDDERERYLAMMEPIEPIRFVGRAAPSALLMQSARKDEIIPVANAEAWQKAASEPKTLMWYDAGHRLPPEAFADQAKWLAGRIGIDATKYVHPT